jgi:hypothetical protein
MADITKCSNDECNIKDKCYRYTAPDNDEWQSYATFKLRPNGGCDYMTNSFGQD